LTPASQELSIILPVYNEEAGLADLLAALERFAADNRDVAMEVLFVDDHSIDRTPTILKQECRANPRYRYLRLSRNCGSHIAILAGLENARGACAVFLASDLQDPPALIPKMLRLWREGHQVVWAVRNRREGVSRRERAFARMFYWLLNRLSEVSFPPQGADFALLDRKVVSALLASAGSDPSLGADIASLGFRQAQVPYVKAARQFGRSKWNLRKRLKAFADAFVGHSFAPIRFMSYAGLLMALIGFIYALAVIALRLTFAVPVEGWASLMVVTLIAGGMQMTMLGILGEYLTRTLREARGRPRHIVEEYLESADDGSGWDAETRDGRSQRASPNSKS
jgi:polyisoprenyl-phosphate glycosyltransferase